MFTMSQKISYLTGPMCTLYSFSTMPLEMFTICTTPVLLPEWVRKIWKECHHHMQCNINIWTHWCNNKVLSENNCWPTSSDETYLHNVFFHSHFILSKSVVSKQINSSFLCWSLKINPNTNNKQNWISPKFLNKYLSNHLDRRKQENWLHLWNVYTWIGIT